MGPLLAPYLFKHYWRRRAVQIIGCWVFIASGFVSHPYRNVFLDREMPPDDGPDHLFTTVKQFLLKNHSIYFVIIVLIYSGVLCRCVGR